MLEIQHLTVSLPTHTLIEDLCLSLNATDKLAVIGEEGNGKSTLFKIIMNENTYADVHGEVQTFHQNIGYLKQALTKEEQSKIVKDYLFVDEMEYYNAINELYQLFPTLLLDDRILDKEIHVLSGGEKVKIQLLKILLQQPDLLLLDEPTNDLDIPTLEWLESFIQKATIPIMFISHDETLLSRCANRILHIEQLNKQSKCRHVIFNGGYQDYVETRIKRYNKEIQIAKKEKAEYTKKKIKLNNIQNALHDALNDTVRNPHQAALLKKKMSNVKAMEKRFEKEGYSKVDSVEEHIHLHFSNVTIPNRKRILDLHLPQLSVNHTLLASPISLEIYGAQHVVITGQNGCGKSTLMKLIYDQLKHRSDINVGYMPQHYEQLLNDSLTPIEFLCPSLRKEDITEVRKRLGNLNFTRDEMISKMSTLSGGSKAKLILLHLVWNAYDVLLLDEPTRNVSPLSNPIIREALHDYQGCIISVSHDRKYIQEVCDTVYVMDQQGLHLQQESDN